MFKIEVTRGYQTPSISYPFNSLNLSGFELFHIYIYKNFAQGHFRAKINLYSLKLYLPIGERPIYIYDAKAPLCVSSIITQPSLPSLVKALTSTDPIIHYFPLQILGRIQSNSHW